MDLNLDFLCAALAIMIIVFVRFFLGRKDSRFNTGNLVALSFMITADIFFDFLVSSGALLSFSDPLAATCGAFLLVLQCATLALFCWHVVVLSGGLKSHRVEILAIASLPLIAVAALLLSNFKTHAAFTYDAGLGVLLPGPLWLVPILCTAFYAVMGAVVALVRRRAVRRAYVHCTIMFVAIVLVCSGIELLDPAVRIVSFGLALGLSILVSEELNPYEYLDTLTHAYDITAFRNRIASLNSVRRRYSVVLVSLDRLSELRLIVGSTAADELLRQCANACRRIGRTRKVYRVRDSVFAIFAFSHREENRLRQGLEGFFAIEHEVAGTRVTPYGRVAIVDQATKLGSPEQEVQYLDYLMDKMRKGEPMGDGAVSLDEFVAYRSLRRYLEKAMAEDLFDVFFQPSWSVGQGCFCSLEALSRLSHPEHGLLPTADFISIAENEGFVTKLDRMQFARVCRFAVEHGEVLRSLGISSIKVNLSPVDLLGSDLGEWLVQTMLEHGVSPSFIQFEVTETSATQYGDELARLIQTLTDSGSSLCMDDFGSGYANLKMVLGLPFSVVKLDRSLLEGIEQPGPASIMYSNIVAMLHGLGFTVVAEGAETEEQVEVLRSFGVDEIQGFFFARPMPQAELLELLAGEVAVA